MSILDILFPPVCIGCNRLGSSICKSCVLELQPTIVDVCPYCYQPSPWGKTHDRCLRNNGLDGAISIFRYNTLAKKIVKRMKYARAWQVLFDLSQQTPKHWWRVQEYMKDIIIDHNSHHHNLVYQPIPLHTSREKARGFNQSIILTKILEKYCILESVDAVVRIKNTLPQAKQPSRAERVANIKNAFIVNNNELVLNKKIILVDDLFTSGSTAKECARVLKKAGAHSVYLIALAHGR